MTTLNDLRRFAVSRSLFMPTAIVGLLVLVSHTASAQNVVQYLALAREYADGRGNDADVRLALWTKDDLTATVNVALTTAGLRELLAAAMLHTDLANTIVDTQPYDADFHLTKARALLGAASERLTDHERVEAFTQRWFRFVARMYGSCDRPTEAARYVRLGLLAFPENPRFYTTRGILLEVRLRAILADWRRGVALNATVRRNAEEILKTAAFQFLQALSLDSHDAEARLHLGWGHFFLEDRRAKTELDAALAYATNDTVRYLAHLFLGGLAERENRLMDALHEYESARALGAGYQTPYVALSRIEEALGDGEHARELALVAVQLHKNDDDPWWDHRIGFDRETLNWLRAEVRRP
jgi:hypothetical protein